MNVCNYKEINALFALYKGVQWSPLHQPSKPRISSHRIRRTHRNDCAENILPQISQMLTDF